MKVIRSWSTSGGVNGVLGHLRIAFNSTESTDLHLDGNQSLQGVVYQGGSRIERVFDGAWIGERDMWIDSLQLTDTTGPVTGPIGSTGLLRVGDNLHLTGRVTYHGASLAYPPLLNCICRIEIGEEGFWVDKDGSFDLNLTPSTGANLTWLFEPHLNLLNGGEDRTELSKLIFFDLEDPTIVSSRLSSIQANDLAEAVLFAEGTDNHGATLPIAAHWKLVRGSKLMMDGIFNLTSTSMNETYTWQGEFGREDQVDGFEAWAGDRLQIWFTGYDDAGNTLSLEGNSEVQPSLNVELTGDSGNLFGLSSQALIIGIPTVLGILILAGIVLIVILRREPPKPTGPM